MASISAFAQSTVAITGNIDLGYAKTTENGNKAAVGIDEVATDGTSRVQKRPLGNGAEGWTSSQVVMTISEDLGNGMKAGYVLDMNLSSWGAGADSANQGLGSQRQSFLSLSDAKMGELRMGYQYTLQDQIQGGIGRATPTGNVGGRIQNFSFNTDPNRAAFKAPVANNEVGTTPVNREGYEVISAGNVTRANAFQYASPVMSGFQAMVQYATQANDQTQSDATKNGVGNGKLQGFAVKYSQGPLNLGLAHQKIVSEGEKYGTAATSDQKVSTKDTNFAANYDFGVAKVFLNKFTRTTDITAGTDFGGAVTTNTWGLFKNNGQLKRTGQDLGVSAPFGKTTLFASVGSGKYKIDTDGSGDAGEAKIKARLLGATYDLSKRTSLNAYYAMTKATYEGQLNDMNKKTIGAGLRHSF